MPEIGIDIILVILGQVLHIGTKLKEFIANNRQDFSLGLWFSKNWVGTVLGFILSITLLFTYWLLADKELGREAAFLIGYALDSAIKNLGKTSEK